jgi:ketosteroid isomerase-like protein
MNFYTKVIGGFAALLLVALAFIFLFRTSEEKAIEQLLEKGLKAAEAGDAEGVIALISPHYKNGEETRESIVRKIRQAVGQRISPASLKGSAIQVSGDVADATATVVVGALQLRREFSLSLKLKKENGEWKVTSADEAGR